MRIAAIYDIHANLPALEAVLEDIRKAGVDRIIVGGDALPGPMPREMLACLRGLSIPAQFIAGNGDRVVLEYLSGKEPLEVPEQFREVIRWNARQLLPEDAQFLAQATCSSATPRRATTRTFSRASLPMTVFCPSLLARTHL